MTEEFNPTTTSDERTLAGLAHLFGALAALIIWVTQKDKSRFVRFQAVQALAFDFTVMLLMMILFFCLFGAMFAGMFGMMLIPLSSSNPAPENVLPFVTLPFMLFPGTFSCIFPLTLGVLIARVMAAVAVLNGKNFHYPILGTQVEKFLSDPSKP
jgi:uncharacterized Tic20 family protein